MDEYGRRLDEMNELVSEACRKAGHEKMRIYYSAYDTDEMNLPENNLDVRVATGEFTVVVPGDDFFGNGNEYRKEGVRNPTWLDLAVLANESIPVTEDYHHTFLEGAYHPKDDLTTICLAFGS